MEKSYKQYLAQINTLIFDVDGVLTNGLVTVMSNGELIRQMPSVEALKAMQNIDQMMGLIFNQRT